MTLEDWLACSDHDSLALELDLFPDRKLHLLTAALLRRVWDKLPSDHSRFAVTATERFADGLIDANALAWARSQAARESDEPVWLARGFDDDYHMLNWQPCCPDCDFRAARYGCRMIKQGGILDGARNGIGNPAWTATGAAFYTLTLDNPGAARAWHGAEWQWEWRSLFATASEVLGEDGAADSFDPKWRTADVCSLAQYIYDHQAFDVLPILADALQDAGCDDATVLDHCRRPGGHVRGCWVVDAALGR